MDNYFINNGIITEFCFGIFEISSFILVEPFGQNVFLYNLTIHAFEHFEPFVALFSIFTNYIIINFVLSYFHRMN